MDDEEIAAVLAIYGELAEVRGDGTVAIATLSSDESREALLLLSLPPGYPNETPRLLLEGRRGVKNEALLAMRAALESEAKVSNNSNKSLLLLLLVFFGVDSCFSGAAGDGDGVCAGRKAQVAAGRRRGGAVDECERDGGGGRAARRGEAAQPPGGRAAHHAGHAMHGECVYGVARGEMMETKDERDCCAHMQSKLQKWLEKRALQLAERRRLQEEAAEGKPTGKQMFLAARDDDKAAREVLSQLIADENVDESLFS